MLINRKEFISALEEVRPGLSVVEIVENSTCFNFGNGILFTYNDEICVQRKFPLGEDLKFSVSAKELLALLKKIKDEEVLISFDEQQLKIKAQDISAGLNITTGDVFDVDSMGVNIDKCKFQELPEDFLNGIRQCLSSVSTQAGDDTILSCIHMKKDTLESCDDFSITRYTLPKKIFQQHIMLPGRSAKYLFSYPKINSYAVASGWIHFKVNESVSFSCRTLEDDQPKWGKFLKVEGEEVEFPKDLNDALDTAGVFSNDPLANQYTMAAHVRIEKGQITVKGEGNSGWATKKSKCAYSGERTIEFITSIPLLKIFLKAHNKAIVAKDKMRFESGNFVHVISLIQGD